MRPRSSLQRLPLKESRRGRSHWRWAREDQDRLGSGYGGACPPILGAEKLPAGASAWKPLPSSRGRERAVWRPHGTGWSPMRRALPLPTPGITVQIALGPAQQPGSHLAWLRVKQAGPRGWGTGAWRPALLAPGCHSCCAERRPE